MQQFASTGGELVVTSEKRPAYDDGKYIVIKNGKEYSAYSLKPNATRKGVIGICELNSFSSIENIEWDGVEDVKNVLEKNGYTIKRTDKTVYNAKFTEDKFTISRKQSNDSKTDSTSDNKVIIKVKALAKKGQANVVFYRTDGVKKYQVRYSTSKKMTKSLMLTKKATLKGTDAIGKIKVKKIVSNKKYYFQVRTITKDATGKTVYGQWSEIYKYQAK